MGQSRIRQLQEGRRVKANKTVGEIRMVDIRRNTWKKLSRAHTKRSKQLKHAESVEKIFENREAIRVEAG